jgi:uncharacterized alkaline shock family protein YloU
MIAGTAALEVEGVAGIAGHHSGDARKTMSKQMAKGINVAVKAQQVSLTMAIAVRMGTKLHKISAEIQQRVKSAIETMTGLNVAEVNVSVGAIVSQGKRARIATAR